MKEEVKKLTPNETKGGKINKKELDKDMQEALKVAQEIERQEEEEFMRKAIEESKQLE